MGSDTFQPNCLAWNGLLASLIRSSKRLLPILANSPDLHRLTEKMPKFVWQRREQKGPQKAKPPPCLHFGFLLLVSVCLKLASTHFELLWRSFWFLDLSPVSWLTTIHPFLVSKRMLASQTVKRRKTSQNTPDFSLKSSLQVSFVIFMNHRRNCTTENSPTQKLHFWKRNLNTERQAEGMLPQKKIVHWDRKHWWI